MVRSTILLSAIIACIGSISAIPTPDASLLDVDGGHHIGTDAITLNNVLNDAGSVNNAEVEGNRGNGGGNRGNDGGRPPINRPSRRPRPHRPHRPFRPDVGGDYDHVHGPGCGCMKRDNGIDLAKRGDHKHSPKASHKGHTKHGKATMNKMDSRINMD
ncbi:hypothetical protein INT48_008924 [Thamnidium elegans]|uniref:Uncharacterized protein n=1 Tax=Thamnidium elegans TaxID=101142 RepID=A0A8H7SPS0_9FUNG|nr:hypothetical protein INT48_008924 [Thamnidium elegans]